MMKFFNHIRQQLLTEGKTAKYIKYAIGEIVLVVIGILIALYLNNWNTNQSREAEINRYYNTIYNELNKNLEYIRDQPLAYSQFKLDVSQKVLEIIMTNNGPDSLKIWKNSLGELTIANFTTTPPFQALNEFRDLKYITQIQDDSLKFYINQTLDGYLDHAHKAMEYERNYLENTIKPFLAKRINYSKIVDSSSFELKSVLKRGGPQGNYAALKNNLEFYNLITFYLEMENQNKVLFEFWIESIKNFSNYLERSVKLNDNITPVIFQHGKGV